MEIFSFSSANVLLHWIWPILQFIIGLGLVVFVHELGHFLVAKAVGIKVERFALGIGPRLFGIVRGETDYCINLLPFAGYLKMLGQEDVKPLEQEYADPRAFNNKSVGARFLVISAGVVMNVIFSAVLFVIVCMIGRSFVASVVGHASPGWPAASARIVWDEAAATRPTGAATQPLETIGLEPGDRILAIDDTPISRFDLLKIRALLAKRGQTFNFKIERRINGVRRTGTAEIGVRPLHGGLMLGFGIGVASDTVIHVADEAEDTPFRSGDRVLAIDGRPVKHHWDIRGITDALDGRPIAVRVLRKDKKTNQQRELDLAVMPELRSSERVFYRNDGTRFVADRIKRDKDKKTRTVLLPDGTEKEFSDEEITHAAGDEQLDILGMVPRFRVGLVLDGSPAEDAGLQPGDIVRSYGGRGTPTLEQFREICDRFAGRRTNLVVRRGSETKTFWITPKKRRDGTQVGVVASVDAAHPVVAAVRPGSPADKAGIKSLARITAVAAADPNTSIGITSWIDLYRALAKLKGREVKIVYKLGARDQTADIGVLDESKFDAADYRFDVFGPSVGFQPLMIRVVKRNPAAAGAQASMRIPTARAGVNRRAGAIRIHSCPPRDHFAEVVHHPGMVTCRWW